MSIGQRIKERREELNLTQEELAKLLGVSKGAVGNYETEISFPKIENMTKLFEILKTDANFLFQDDIPLQDDSFTELEKSHIKKYRILDEHGKKLVSLVLEAEYERCTFSQPIKVYRAARSSDHHEDEIIEISAERLKKIREAPDTDDEDL